MQDKLKAQAEKRSELKLYRHRESEADVKEAQAKAIINNGQTRPQMSMPTGLYASQSSVLQCCSKCQAGTIIPR